MAHIIFIWGCTALENPQNSSLAQEQPYTFARSRDPPSQFALLWQVQEKPLLPLLPPHFSPATHIWGRELKGGGKKSYLAYRGRLKK